MILFETDKRSLTHVLDQVDQGRLVLPVLPAEATGILLSDQFDAFLTGRQERLAAELAAVTGTAV